MARKMALIPAEMIPQQNLQQYLPNAPLLGQLSSLDHQMKSILEDRMNSSENKIQQYYNALRRYDTMQESARGPIPVRIERASGKYPIPPPEQREGELAVVDLPVPENELLENVPKAQRQKAKILIKHIKENPNISWNSEREMVYNGRRVPNSNIIDLVSDITRNRKRQVPATGWEEFAHALMERNIPREAVANDQRWEYIVSKRNLPFQTPTTTTTNTGRINRKRHQEDLEEEDDDLFENLRGRLSFEPSSSARKQQLRRSAATSTSATGRKTARRTRKKPVFETLHK